MTVDDKRFNGVADMVSQHNEKIHAIETKQAVTETILETIKSNTEEIKTKIDTKFKGFDEKLDKLPCSQHAEILTKIRTKAGITRRVIYITAVSSGGIVGAIATLLKILDII